MKIPTRILVVDDDPGVFQLFGKVLRSEGYEVLEASSGLQALEMTHQFHPDLVLLDINLPDMRGMEVCKEIKSDKSLPDVFVALISGEATSATDKAGGLEIGADDYITKPVDIAEFRARVRTFVRLQNTAAALRASEQHYRQLMEILPDAVLAIDLQNRLMTVNGKAVSMFGCADTAELLEKTAFDLIVPEEHERLRTAIAGTLNDDAIADDEYTIIRKGGEHFPAELRAVVLKDEVARPLGLVMVARDITERKQSEQALRESEARKIAIMQSAPDAIVAIDHLGKIIDCNSAAETIFGESPRKLMGQEMASVMVSPTLRDWFRRGLADSFRGSTGPRLGSRTETVALRAGGIEFPIELTITPIELTSPPLFTAFIRDISSKRRSEEQIHLLAYAVQTARELICITDRENRFTFVNQAFLDACGYKENEVLGNTPHFLYPGSNPPGLCEHIHQQTLAGGWKGELLNCRKDGTEFPISLNTAQIKNRDGDVIGLIGVARDITLQKQAEEELRGLPRLIIEAQETERLRVSRELHDSVNQLIASVKMRIHKVADTLSSSNPAAEGILARCDQLLVKALEENRRIAHNLHPSDLSNLGLATACRNLCEELRARTNLIVRCRISSTLKRLPAACELNLFRILQEATNNIERHARASTVQAVITLRRDLIVLRVRDDGRGFDLQRYLAGNKKNRGVGLTNMRERAASLRGVCEVESEPGKGTSVTVRFPYPGTN